MPLVRLPGLIDPHVHLRDPGATHKEDFTTGTRAAIAGGITMVLDMPNNPGAPVVTPDALEAKERATERRLLCDVGLYYGASARNAATYPEVAGRVFGLKLYLDHTTGDLKVDELEDIRDVMRAWPADKPLLVHAEDRTVAMVLGLVEHLRRSVHFCHVSRKVEIEMIRDAKERGLPVTCEVAPHHLFLTEDDVPRLGGFGVMKPPLRRRTDVDALWANLDAVDMIATDHAPHTVEEKQGEHPAFGIPGLETSLPLMLTAVHQGRLSLDRLVEMMHDAPARVFQTPPQPDTYIEVDTERRWTITTDAVQSKCGWTAFEGMSVVGAVRRVVLRGVTALEDGMVKAEPGPGRLVRPG
jgi:carbamoyl-phosphate synthase/aspartate carbamoyltransferase/dihydroorotase